MGVLQTDDVILNEAPQVTVETPINVAAPSLFDQNMDKTDDKADDADV